MRDYTLRIQLVGDPTQEVFDDLHVRMKHGGFLQTISGKKKGVLPHGTYYGSVNATPQEVLDWAKTHAKEAWGKSVIFVAETSMWAWSGPAS